MRDKLKRFANCVNWPLLLSLLIFVYLGSMLGPVVSCYDTGKPAVAELVRYVPRTDDEGRRIHFYELGFDGHRVARRFGRLRELGEKFPVTYHVGRPESVIKGARPDSVWSIIDQNTNDFMLGLALAVAALLLLGGISQARRKK